jgi:hypothetical protein
MKQKKEKKEKRKKKNKLETEKEEKNRNGLGPISNHGCATCRTHRPGQCIGFAQVIPTSLGTIHQPGRSFPIGY